MSNKEINQGFIFKRTLVGDKGAYLTLFTKEFGKLIFFVRNLRDKKKNFLPYISIGNEVEVSYKKGNSTNTIIDIKLISSPGNLEYNKLILLSYFVEISNKITVENQNNLEFYSFFGNIIKLLINQDNLLKTCLVFEIKLLTIFGFLGQLNLYINSNKKIDLDKENIYVGELGGIIENLELTKIIKNENHINNLNQKGILQKNKLKPVHIKTFYFLQNSDFEDIFNLKIDFETFKNEMYIFRKNLGQNIQSKINLNPCFFGENMLK